MRFPTHSLASAIVAALLFTGCETQSPTKPVSHESGQAASAESSPVHMLAGRWHNNDFERAGATKQFTPDPKNTPRGRADGFWPTGGHYEVLESDSANRSLKLLIQSHPSEDQAPQSVVARITFRSDGQRLTWAKLSGTAGPEGTLEFYRTH